MASIEIKLSRCAMVNTTHAEECERDADIEGNVLSFWVNKIRFRTTKSAMSSVLGGYSWGTMLVGFVDRRYSLRSVAKTDHSVSTIFYWRTLDLLYNKRLIRLARAEKRRKVRTNHVANCCRRGGSRIPGRHVGVIDDAVIFAKPRAVSSRTRALS